MSWPEAFAIAITFLSLFGFLFGLLAYRLHVQGEVMKEAIRNGATSFEWDGK